jgi:opacity protein-like surface antigen
MSKTFVGLFVFGVFVAGASSAWAQPVSLGLKIGTPLTDAYSLNPANVATFAAVAYQPDRANFIIGPTIEVRLPFRFSLEADALYRSDGFQMLSPSNRAVNPKTWEFPVLAKYKLFGGPVRPYIAGGVAFKHLSDIGNVPEALHSKNYGVVVGAGLEIHALILKISPEVRYTGYTLRDFQSVEGILQSKKNQTYFVVGINF